MGSVELILLVSLVACLHVASGLECYACVRQDNNKDKCVKTTKQCEEHQDVCMSVVSWGLPPYWVPHGDRMHFVAKDCERNSVCEAQKRAGMKRCKRDWFSDWECIECCNGDLCNHYVTLGTTQTRASFLTVVVMFLVGVRLMNR